jgi:hypothetical protein
MSDPSDLQGLAERAAQQMSVFLSPGADLAAAMMALQPQPGDHERVFSPEIAAGMARVYSRLWDKPPLITAKKHQTHVRVRLCRAVELVLETRRAMAFPGGYRRIAAHLQPDSVWICWKYTAPGNLLGTAYEGLVAVDERFVWFPRPYDVVPRLLEESN